MKKKRKKKEAIRRSTPSLGNAPDDPYTQSNRFLSFRNRLFECSRSDILEKVFEIKVTANTAVKWDTVVRDKTLFVFVPNDLSQVGSKESFVALLEVAEEDLGCEYVVACIGNDSAEKASHVRTFKYMGFEPVPRGNVIVEGVVDTSDFLFLGYEL